MPLAIKDLSTVFTQFKCEVICCDWYYLKRSSYFCRQSSREIVIIFCMKHRGWISLSGFVWLMIGSSLTYKGLKLIALALTDPDSMCSRLETIFGSPAQAGTVFIAVGMVVGFLKSRFVLSKTVRRVTSRILSLPTPIRLKDAYSPSYWILISSMVVLGMSFRFLPISMDIRGAIDVAIGTALINGAMLYFRLARTTCDSGSLSQSQ